MAIGIHWEWRGFGAVSYDFVKKFCDLPELYSTSFFDDAYIWIPNSGVNTKYRESKAEEGLKFKRQINKDGNLEQWSEKDEEIFEFPLEEEGWITLAKVLTEVGLELGNYPQDKPDRETTISYLINAGCVTVPVPKMRVSRIWKRSTNHLVKVEWANVSTPQIFTSIGLENYKENVNDEDLPDKQAKDDILSAIDFLGLDNEPLKVMNYLDAVTVWALGGRFYDWK